MASSQVGSQNSNLFTEYIGVGPENANFSDVPINPKVKFHFLLSFAVDSNSDGNFTGSWYPSLTPQVIESIKKIHPINVRVGVSLGGSEVDFRPTNKDSWVSNAVTSLTNMIREYHLDGIDIDYENFPRKEPGVFKECIGRLITNLKNNGVVKFVSIAPYDAPDVQAHYQALWSNIEYRRLIDYVNFQFYAYPRGTTRDQFLQHFDRQRNIYKDGNMLASFISDGSVGLPPGNDFFDACRRLQQNGQLYGIFVWSANLSKRFTPDFRHEIRAQKLLE